MFNKKRSTIADASPASMGNSGPKATCSPLTAVSFLLWIIPYGIQYPVKGCYLMTFRVEHMVILRIFTICVEVPIAVARLNLVPSKAEQVR